MTTICVCPGKIPLGAAKAFAWRAGYGKLAASCTRASTDPNAKTISGRLYKTAAPDAQTSQRARTRPIMRQMCRLCAEAQLWRLGHSARHVQLLAAASADARVE